MLNMLRIVCAIGFMGVGVGIVCAFFSTVAYVAFEHAEFGWMIVMGIMSLITAACLAMWASSIIEDAKLACYRH